MFHGADLDPILADLLGCPLAIDVVDTLLERPVTVRAVRSRVRARRRAVDTALRLLAVHQLIRRRWHSGSWDARLPARVPLELTGRGLRLAAQLARLDVWVAIYEHYLDAQPERG